MAGMQRSPRMPQFPERLKGGRLERWKDYWLGVATDYRDALVEMGQSARKKPVKASIVVSLLGRLIVKIFIGTVNTKLTTSCPYWLLLNLYRTVLNLFGSKFFSGTGTGTVIANDSFISLVEIRNILILLFNSLLPVPE